MEVRHKDASKENFTVGMLVKKPDREIVMQYYKFARYCDDIADDPKMTPEEKIKKLDEAENALFEKQNKSKKLKFISDLRNSFIKENLSFALITELLKAFRKDAAGFEYETWSQLVDYCQYSAVPVGRFMLALHDENPSTYIPAASLCTALQIVNHIQDIKYDAAVLKRVYIPKDLMKKYSVSKEDLTQDKCSLQLKKLIAHIMNKMEGLIKESMLLPPITKSLRLRMEICIIISLTNIMIKKIENGDVLKDCIKLSKPDWLRAAITGMIRGIFTKRRISGSQGL